MLIGFVALLGVYLVSLMMNLEATQLLLDNLGQSLVLVLVVLFQADIRNALAQIGVFTLFREGLHKKGMWWTAYYSRCCYVSKSIGALIVLEQEGPENYSDRGTQINAAVSESLLLSIFILHHLCTTVPLLSATKVICWLLNAYCRFL